MNRKKYLTLALFVSFFMLSHYNIAFNNGKSKSEYLIAWKGGSAGNGVKYVRAQWQNKNTITYDYQSGTLKFDGIKKNLLNQIFIEGRWYQDNYEGDFKLVKKDSNKWKGWWENFNRKKHELYLIVESKKKELSKKPKLIQPVSYQPKKELQKLNKAVEKTKKTPPELLNTKYVIYNEKERKIFFTHLARERKHYGTIERQKMHKTKKYKKTLIIQRSGRKRLYDHNIIMASMFKKRIHHKNYGSLDSLFNKGVFLDFGSAILSGKGAPTVRDIYDDKRISPYLSKIIATDINDNSSPKTQFINIYKKQKKQLPFPVKEIPKLISSKHQINKIIEPFIKKDSPLIFRSCNSGPDLYYTKSQIQTHLKAVIQTGKNRNVLYFFNKFVLFKHKTMNAFQLIGTIDPRVGINHRWNQWEKINWKRRSIYKAFRYNQRYIKIIWRKI